MEKSKNMAALLSIISNATLIILKIIAGIISGSIGIISEAIHSGSDILASFIAFYSVSKSSQPADEDHSFGHGKYEDLSGLIEGALIIAAAVFIIKEAIKKLIYPTGTEINANIAIAVMLFSVIINIFVSLYLFKIAKKTDSIALYADAEHLRTDIYSSFAVFIGLLAVKYTGNLMLDPIIAIIVALIIFVSGYQICETAANNLLDRSLKNEDIKRIHDILETHIGTEVVSIKSVRTRKSGIKKNIDIILITNPALHISTAHKICDAIEDEIEKTLHNTDISIHLEPA